VEEDFAGLLELLGLSTADLARLKVLEIGFGHGRILREIQKHCPHAYGVDLARPLASATLRPRSVVLGSLFRLPFVPGQFDLVICRGVIHHTPDVRLAFTRVAEQVAPGGRLYLYIYEQDVPRSLLLRRLIPFSWLLPEPLRLILSKTLGAAWAGFRTATVRPFDPGRYPSHRGATTLGVFDILSPRWTTRHAPEEVLSWFQEESLVGRRVSACNYLGERPDAPG
jgi:SAM-dependent methyltransferase